MVDCPPRTDRPLTKLDAFRSSGDGETTYVTVEEYIRGRFPVKIRVLIIVTSIVMGMTHHFFNSRRKTAWISMFPLSFENSLRSALAASSKEPAGSCYSAPLLSMTDLIVHKIILMSSARLCFSMYWISYRTRVLKVMLLLPFT